MIQNSDTNKWKLTANLVTTVLLFGALYTSNRSSALNSPMILSSPLQIAPKVSFATIKTGKKIFYARQCNDCHYLANDPSSDADQEDYDDTGLGYGDPVHECIGPDLTYEAHRHSSIAWQVRNLKDHSTLFPKDRMGDQSDGLTWQQIRALAAYMATRR